MHSPHHSVGRILYHHRRWVSYSYCTLLEFHVLVDLDLASLLRLLPVVLVFICIPPRGRLPPRVVFGACSFVARSLLPSLYNGSVAIALGGLACRVSRFALLIPTLMDSVPSTHDGLYRHAASLADSDDSYRMPLQLWTRFLLGSFLF